MEITITTKTGQDVYLNRAGKIKRFLAETFCKGEHKWKRFDDEMCFCARCFVTNYD